MIAYRVMPDVPRELVAYLAALLRAERRARGTRRKARALTCFRQALFALVWFRKREDLTVLGAGFGISRATASGHRDEAVAVLSAEAPDLTEAVDRVQGDGWSHVILDGRSSTPTGAGPRPPVETHRHKPQNQHHQRSAFSARSTPPSNAGAHASTICGRVTNVFKIPWTATTLATARNSTPRVQSNSGPQNE